MTTDPQNPGTRGDLIKSLEHRYSPGEVRRRSQRRLVNGTGWLVWITLLSGLKRVLDVVIALVLLTLAALPAAALWLYAKSRGGGISKSVRLGRWAAPFDLYHFSCRSGLDDTALAKLPVLWNLLRGDLALIGPRAATPETNPVERLAWKRYQVRPGLICLWWIRRRANIAYATEAQVDAEYIDTQSLRGDLGIALRAIPAAFYGEGVSEAPDIIHLAGIPIHNLSMDEAVEYIADPARQDPVQICFVNADCVNIAARNAAYKQLLQQSDLVLGDGIGIKLAGKILNTHLRQNVNGTDLFPRLCARLDGTAEGIYLLGGKPGVPEDVAAWIGRNHPGVKISGTQHGYFAKEETAGVLQAIHDSGAHVLLIAFGAPKQELFIRDHLRETGVKVAIGVGGLFDFYSGRIPRAPAWLREMGGEWLYRFIQEPRRMWRRYFVGNVIFLYRVFQFRAALRRQESQNIGGA